MSEHSKTPWRMGSARYGAIVADEVVNNLGSNTEESVKAYGGYMVAESVSKANAEHIINCVNSHDALLDRIDALEKEIEALK